MKKIENSLLKSYSPVVLYLEDLEKIISIFESTGTKIELEAEDYSFDSISEMHDYFGVKNPKNLVIRFKDHRGKLHLNNGWAILMLDNDSNESAGIFYQIDKIMSASERKPKILCSSIRLVFTLIIYTLVLISLKLIGINITYIVFIPFIPFIPLCIYVRYIETRHSTIILEHRKNKQSFIKRNYDAIIVGLFVGIICLIINALASGMSSKYSDKSEQSKPASISEELTVKKRKVIDKL